MTKKVIALQGKSNTGKTTTIHALIMKLLNEKTRFKFVASERIGRNKGTVDNINILMQRLNKGYDTWVVFEKIETHEKIGITCRGDAKKYLVKDFDAMRKSSEGKGCDFYVCAVHTVGDTVNFLIEEFGVLNTYYWGRPQVAEEDYKSLNERDTNILYNIILHSKFLREKF